jgi:hypothetical protein
MPIALSKSTYARSFGDPVVTYEVLYDGRLYRCSSVDLDLLYKGRSPEDLELREIEDDDA